MELDDLPSPAEPPVFVVGCGRSGTTMLRLMLDAHPELAIPGESHFLITLWKGLGRFTEAGRLDAEALVREAMRSHQFRYWGVDEDAVLRRVRALRDPGFADAVTALYMAYADLHGKRRWGDKTPQYVRSIPELSRIFDGSKFVHVIRDGRDVASSYLAVEWGPPNVWRAAEIWRRDVSAGMRAGRALGPERYTEVRYEELVRATPDVLRRLCGFLELIYEPVMLDYHREAEHRMGARPDRARDHASATRPPTQGVRDWRTQMPDDQVLAVEAIAGDLLRELGYERRSERIAVTTVATNRIRSRLVKPRLPGGRRIRSAPRKRAASGRANTSGGPTLAGRVLVRADSRSRRRRVGAVVRAAWPLLPATAPPTEPIFVLGSPRSGTTMLFGVLAASPAVGSLPGEGHLLWNLFHDEGSPGFDSQATLPEAIARGERRALYWMIRQIANGRRYLDKTPRNSLQVPYLHALFPDARFVFLARDGRATVSSLINGWRDATGLFPGRRVRVPLAIDGYAGDRWKFVVPPGWEACAQGHTLAEVCAFQWKACSEAILAARDLIDPGRWVETSYERFVESPGPETARILVALHLPVDDGVVATAGRLDRRVTKATSPPRPEKWREENPDEIASILPLIAPTMRRLGYDA